MTREEIKTITDIVHKTIYTFFDVCGDDEEVPMTDKDELLLSVNKAICKSIRALEQEPCGDLISRETVKAYKYHRTMYPNFEDYVDMLPPVKPQEPREGHWIKVTNGRGGHECDVCHNYAPSFQNGDEYLSAFCPNCGARMESEE